MFGLFQLANIFRFIHVVLKLLSFLLKVRSYSDICINCILLIHLSVNGHLGYIHLSVMWIMLQWILRYEYLSPCFQFLKYIPKNEIAGTHGNFMMIFFFFLRNTKLFSTAATTCNILHPHQWCTSVPNYSHSFQYLLFSVFQFFLNNHTSRYDTLSRGLDLHFLND